MKANRRLVVIIILTYLLVVMPVITIQYLQLRYAVLDGINRDLYTAANDIGSVLNRDFHETWTPEHPISDQAYEILKNQLNRYADNFELEYVYTMVKRDDTVYFVASNETEEDLERGTPSLFYNPYPDPPDAVMEAFEADEPCLSSSYRNIWNSFYSVFIPRHSPSGITYVLAADIKLDLKRDKLHSSLNTLIAMIIIALASALPLSLLLVSRQRRKASSFEEQLYQDFQTGLPNRLKFMEDYRKIGRRSLSAVMFDLDSFRQVNNLFGGYSGDQVLKHSAELIRRCCSPSDALYKFPADEFVLVMEDRSLDDVIAVAEKAVQTFYGESFVTKGQDLILSVRAGVSHRPDSRRKLLSSVNIAKNLAKKEARSYVLYDDSMDREEAYSRNFSQLNRLKEALDEDRIVPFYQPISCNDNGEICKYEALVRMLCREGNPVTPDQFLSVAKTSKLYKRITLVMIDRVTRDFSGREDQVSINMTIRDLMDRDTMEHLYRRVEENGMRGRLGIELLESESLFLIKDLSVILGQVRERGIYIAIDDFGSGYANFGYLSSVPMDILKIDGALVRGLLSDRYSEAVIKAIAAFSRDLGIPLVAEYVESKETMSRLKEMGVEFSQGYYIGRPVPLGEIGSAAGAKTDSE